MIQPMSEAQDKPVEIKANHISSPHSRSFLQAILETAVDAIVMIDSKGHIQSFNRSAVRMFGYELSEVAGKNVNILMPSPWREHHDAYISNYMKTGEAKIIGIGREVAGIRKNGEVFPIALSVSAVVEQGQWFFIGMIRDITRQRFMEQSLVNAIENERREIGRDLHDALGQIITGISLMSKSLARKVSTIDDKIAEDANTIAGMCVDAMAETKRLAHGAFPTELERYGLKSALDNLLDMVRRIHRVETHFLADENWKPLPPATELHLYRIAQESLANAVKHGKPRNIHCQLQQIDNVVTLTIRDDGTGISEKKEARKISMGLNIMQHRATLIGGDLTIRPARPTGTEVSCCIRHVLSVSKDS